MKRILEQHVLLILVYHLALSVLITQPQLLGAWLLNAERLPLSVRAYLLILQFPTVRPRGSHSSRTTNAAVSQGPNVAFDLHVRTLTSRPCPSPRATVDDVIIQCIITIVVTHAEGTLQPEF